MSNTLMRVGTGKEFPTGSCSDQLAPGSGQRAADTLVRAVQSPGAGGAAGGPTPRASLRSWALHGGRGATPPGGPGFLPTWRVCAESPDVTKQDGTPPISRGPSRKASMGRSYRALSSSAPESTRLQGRVQGPGLPGEGREAPAVDDSLPHTGLLKPPRPRGVPGPHPLPSCLPFFSKITRPAWRAGGLPLRHPGPPNSEQSARDRWPRPADLNLIFL